MSEVVQAQALAEAFSVLPSTQWAVLSGLEWPTPALTAADHVAVGPGGVFVIVVVESREQPATVLLDAPWVGGEFRGDLVERAAEAARAVLAMDPGVDPGHVRPVLCFDQEPMLLERCDDVLVCSAANVISMITSRFPVLNTRQVHTVNARLRAGRRRTRAVLRQVPAQPTAAEPRPRSRAVVVGATALGLALAGGVGLAVANVPGITSAARGLVDSAAPLGRPADVAGPSGELRVTVRSVRPAGEHAGTRLLSVDLVLVDLGARAWTGSPGRSVWLVDKSGDRFRADAGAHAGSRVLPHRATVKPGRPMHGRVLVAVPAGVHPARVEFRIGDGRHGSALWQVP